VTGSQVTTCEAHRIDSGQRHVRGAWQFLLPDRPPDNALTTLKMISQRATAALAPPNRETSPNGAYKIRRCEKSPHDATQQNAKLVDDCGVAMNHMLVEGQVHGGIVQGGVEKLDIPFTPSLVWEALATKA